MKESLESEKAEWLSGVYRVERSRGCPGTALDPRAKTHGLSHANTSQISMPLRHSLSNQTLEVHIKYMLYGTQGC